MSLVVCAYGASWLALASDRGVWENGVKTSEDDECKLQLCGELPFVVTATGPAYAFDFISDWFAKQKFPKSTPLSEVAAPLWAALSAYHRERYGKEPLDIACAALSLIVAGLPSMPSVWLGRFPNPEMICVSDFRFGETILGNGCGFVTSGVHNAQWEAPIQYVDEKGGVSLVRGVLDNIEKMESLRASSGETITIAEPYDILLVSRSGAEWIERAKAEPVRVRQNVAAVVDANGKMPNTTSMNSKLANLLNFSGTPVVSYSSTTSSITISIPATTYNYCDGVNSISIPAYSNTWGGLNASTTYYYDCAVDVGTSAYVVTQSAGNTKLTGAQMLSDCYRDGRICVYSNFQASTPASGTGSGSGGGGGGSGSGCPADYQLIPTLERGLIRADQIDIGMHIPGPGGWVEVTDVNCFDAPIWRYALSDGETEESFDVNDTHALLCDLDFRPVCELKPGQKIKGTHKELTLTQCHYVKEGRYVAMEIAGHVYHLGFDSMSHNPVTF